MQCGVLGWILEQEKDMRGVMWNSNKVHKLVNMYFNSLFIYRFPLHLIFPLEFIYRVNQVALRASCSLDFANCIPVT